MISYECSCCGETHEGIPDLAFRLPQAIFEIDEGEREARCKISDDLCVLDDEHFFVRGLLEVPIADSNDRFAYGAWSTLSHENFLLYAETFDDDQQSHLGPFFGYLANPIPGFADSLYLPQEVHLRDRGARPSFALHAGDHPLILLQSNGMSREELIALAESILHPSSAA